MAKLGLSIGIDADVTGLRKMGQQVTGELEKLRGTTGRISATMSAAMAMPIVGLMSGIVQAHAEARKIRADLMFPFSNAMHDAQIGGDMLKMQVGQRMVGAGLDESAARSMRMGTERELMTGLMAQAPGSMAGKSIENFLTSPTDFLANLVRSAEGMMQGVEAVASEALGGNLTAGITGQFNDPSNRAAYQLGETRMQAGLAMATGQTDQFEGLRMQLERQTYLLADIERNSKGTR